jgi:FkbM family methyltransferase
MLKPKHRQTLTELKSAITVKKVVLFEKNRLTDKVIAAIGPEKIKYIVDNDSEKWGDYYAGFKISSPRRLYAESPAHTVVVVTCDTQHAGAINRQICEIDTFTIFFYNVIDNLFLCDFSARLFDNYGRIRETENYLRADFSRFVLREVVHRRIIGQMHEYGDLRIAMDRQYLFTQMYREQTEQSETIIDCGAFTGDTLERFAGYFGARLKKIYAFEALPECVAILQAKSAVLNDLCGVKMEILPFAASSNKAFIKFHKAEPLGGSFGSDFRSGIKMQYAKLVETFEVESRCIDEQIPSSEKITLIKMDIEGAEYEALLGARQTIIRNQPRLCVAIYHNAEDYFRIAELLHSFVPEYKMAIRHHKHRHVDTVLYAWRDYANDN